MKRLGRCLILALALSLLPSGIVLLGSPKPPVPQMQSGPGMPGQGSICLPSVACNRLLLGTPTPTASRTPTGSPTATATATAVLTLLPGDILTRDDQLITFMEAHDAIYVGNGRIIDALPDGGVQYRSLEGFVADAQDYVIAQRPAAYSEESARGAVDYAVARIGLPYDYAWFGGKDTEDRMYCSELVWRAYLSQGIDLDSNGGAWVWPGEIVQSPLLVEVDVDLGPAARGAVVSGSLPGR